MIKLYIYNLLINIKFHFKKLENLFYVSMTTTSCLSIQLSFRFRVPYVNVEVRDATRDIINAKQSFITVACMHAT